MGKWGLTGGKWRRCSAIGGRLHRGARQSVEGFTVSRRRRGGSRGRRRCAAPGLDARRRQSTRGGGLVGRRSRDTSGRPDLGGASLEARRARCKGNGGGGRDLAHGRELGEGKLARMEQIVGGTECFGQIWSSRGWDSRPAVDGGYDAVRRSSKRRWPET
ncbi:extensin [Iris pallida]|uniref:Extensin n=1 Tax=Iris pallida TaxID=29817 RepID=A0AAX6FE00_IRIPA|nr:extensin [Iris pallida]